MVAVTGQEPDQDTSSPLIPPSSGPLDDASSSLEDYARLKRRLLLATFVAALLAVPLAALFFDLATAGSVLVGSLAGLLYLRLLARSVDRLGEGSKSVGKFQLLVPALLVVAAARLPQLEILPALIGFLLYKPALLIQALLDA
jgi:ATP synthase protein I